MLIVDGPAGGNGVVGDGVVRCGVVRGGVVRDGVVRDGVVGGRVVGLGVVLGFGGDGLSGCFCAGLGPLQVSLDSDELGAYGSFKGGKFPAGQ